MITEKAIAIHNNVCVECRVCEQDMVQVGPVTLCHECFTNMFMAEECPLYHPDLGVVEANNPIYKTLLAKHKLFQRKVAEDD